MNTTSNNTRSENIAWTHAHEVVIVEDDRLCRDMACDALSLAGFQTHAYGDAESALKHVRACQPHAVLTDLYLGGTSGLDLLAQLRQIDPDLPVVLMTGQADVRTAIEAIKAGALDYIEKPFAPDQLMRLMTHAAERRKLLLENRMLKDRLSFASGLERLLVGQSHGMRTLRDMLLRIAPTPANVIILGETGSGKELVARCLHEFSGRRGKFVAINCAAVPENLFESELFGHESGAYTGATKQRIGKIEYANEGTLLLDEIEAMPLSLQVKILRALQEHEVERLGSNKPIPVNVRVIAATKVDLKDYSDQGKFRSDLYYRLNVAGLKIPAMRERREDVPLLFMHFVQEIATRLGQEPAQLTTQLEQQLLAYDWPGNVRELRNAAEQFQFGIPLSVPNSGFDEGSSLDDIVGAVEKSIIQGALRRHDGNANAACTELKINYSMLYRRMKQYGIDLLDFRRAAREHV